MSSRKKPQQQLACYFDELLTELDEQTAQPLEENVASQAAAISTPISAPTISTTTPDTSLIHQSTVTKPSETNSHKRVERKAPMSSPDLPPATYSAPPSARPEAPSFASSSAPEPVMAVKQSLAAPSTQSLPTVDLRQREKDKLERLLNTLTPTVESQLIQSSVDIEATPPVDTAPPTMTQTIVVEAAVADVIVVKPIVAKPVKVTLADLSPTEVQVTETKTIDVPVTAEASVAEPIEMMGTSTHRWQPLGHEWQDNDRPAWAENPFDVLLVEVNGVQLAMPLEALDAIYPLDNALTPLFGQAKWFMGLQKTIEGNVSVINTAQFVMPERYDKDQPSQIKYSVAINGSGWGLAVDKIHQPVLVNPDDIRWRVKRAARPWMAGTVKDHMCALLDIPYLAHSLTTQDKNR